MRHTARAGKYSTVVIVITILVMFAASVPASAHYVYSSGEVWREPNTGNYCLRGYSEISHGIGKGYSKISASAWKPGVDVTGATLPCWWAWYLAPNYISAKIYLEKKDSAGVYRYCNERGTAFNPTNDYQVTATKTWESVGSPSGFCGSGTYRTRAYISVIWGGVRQYRNLYSPGHTLPT